MTFDFIILILTTILVGSAMAAPAQFDSLKNTFTNKYIMNAAPKVQNQISKKDTEDLPKKNENNGYKYVDPHTKEKDTSWKYKPETKPDQWKYKDVSRENSEVQKEKFTNGINDEGKKVDRNGFVRYPISKDLQFVPAKNIKRETIKDREKSQSY